ncbi:MAG: hypothetical protein JSV03_09640 [Planctomycetota bacterium]|nr:MAG: hypothetical protein JSV03_09640 [Planctomycetota bacterium]
MSDQPAEFKWTNWSDNFPFTHIFRTFKMAIHPGKLGLALVGILLTVLSGYILDGIWSTGHKSLSGEVHAFWQMPNIDQWREQKQQTQLQKLQTIYSTVIKDKIPGKLKDRFNENPNKEVNRALEKLKDKYQSAIIDADDQQTAEIARRYNATYAELKSLKPVGIFKSFVSYQQTVCHQLLDAARSLNFTGQLDDVLRGRHRITAQPGTRNLTGIGVVPCLMLMARGEQWMMMEHPLYFLLFAVVTLVIWSLIGGAICRIAALHFTRDERISCKEALGFASRRFVGFFTAPLIPIGLIIFIGLVLTFGGLVSAIPYFGEILAGVAMGLALIGGFLMTLVIIGLLAGGSLLWPTIAVEGSDSFDAMSRSCSYIYSKPWRSGFYALVAMVYGSICYMFVRFFTFIMLKGTRFFVDIGMGATDRPGTGIAGATKLDTLWPQPTFGNFRPPTASLGMEGWDPAGCFLIGIWLLIVVGLMVAFLISFYFSGSTIIYFLLRREVDATDIEDVYLEEEEEAEMGEETAAGEVTAAESPETEPEDTEETASADDEEE